MPTNDAAARRRISVSMARAWATGRNTGRMLMGRARKVDERQLRAYSIALGRNIRQARLEQSVAMDELAAASGVHELTVLAIELGRQNAHYTTIVRIARALGLSPSELIP